MFTRWSGRNWACSVYRISSWGHSSWTRMGDGLPLPPRSPGLGEACWPSHLPLYFTPPSSSHSEEGRTSTQRPPRPASLLVLPSVRPDFLTTNCLPGSGQVGTHGDSPFPFIPSTAVPALSASRSWEYCDQARESDT